MLLQDGHSFSSVVDIIGARTSSEGAAVETALRAFVDELEREDLLVRTDQAAPSAVSAPTPVASGDERPAFVAPVISKFTDMEDLLLLDPIHEVDEMGWPHRKPEPTGNDA